MLIRTEDAFEELLKRTEFDHKEKKEIIAEMTSLISKCIDNEKSQTSKKE